MSSQSLKSKVAKGAVWALLEKLSTQAVGFVVSMVLARLLTPNDYGMVALTGIFFAVAGVLVDGGFGNALIQKKDADDLDFNSVFYISLLLSFFVYAALFFAAPWIADFYDVRELTMIVRISAICFLFNAVNAIQNAELTKKMLFHLSFRVSLIISGTSAVCGITLAILGYGVWALVWATLISGFVGVVARWFIIAWRPRFMFSFQRLGPLFSFGWKMAVSGLLDAAFTNINGLLIGKIYTKSDLAYVNKGNALPSLAMNQVNDTLGRVSFPALVLMQDDRVKLRDAMRRMIQCSTFLVFPLMVAIAVCSHSIIRLLFGSQWTPAAPYMKLACFTFALWPFHTINLKGIMALGRSDVFLKLEVIKKTACILVIALACRLGVLPWMMVTAFVLGPFSVIVNVWPNKKLLDYTLGMQLYDVMSTALICIAEALVIFGIGILADRAKSMLGVVDNGVCLMVFLGVKLVLQFTFGFGAFFILAYVFRLKPMGEYGRMMAGVMETRFPRIAIALKKRFAV